MPRDEYDILLNHEYDGIREYDNPLPGWWRWLFGLSIFFSICYAVWYHARLATPTIHDRYNTRVASFFAGQLEQLGITEATDEAILSIMENEKVMAAMQRTFAGNCGQCHRADGGGNIGPNLTDDVYKNVESPSEIFRVIADGIPSTSMPAWGVRMAEPQMMMLAAYVASLRGTSPAASKEPEGKPIPAWETFIASDPSGQDSQEELESQ